MFWPLPCLYAENHFRRQSHFFGQSFTGTKGKAEGELSDADLKSLVAEFDKARFFELKKSYATEKDGCGEVWTDHPSVSVEIKINGRNKKVYYYFGCGKVSGDALKRISDLGKKIDEITRSQQWTKGWKPDNTTIY